MPPPSFSPLFDFFLSRPILSSSRYSSFFRSVSRRNTRERHGGGRVAYRYNYARASISDLDCVKDTSTQGKGGKEGGGQIMHAIDSGHFVISIPRSSTVLITFAGRLIMRCYDLLFLFLIYPLSLPFLSFLFLFFLFLTLQTFLFRMFIARLSAKRFLACLGDLGEIVVRSVG